MIFFITLIASAISAYLIGAIPTGFILAKIFKGVDIRNLGSSSTGATNVFRVAGKLPSLVTLVIDILKGVFVTTVIAAYAYPAVEILDYDFYRGLLGLIAICGHIWPVFLGFRGGKGVAATIGVLSVITPITLFLSLAVWFIIFSLTGYVSLASIVFGISIPVLACTLNQPFYTILLAVAICLINTYKHSANIRRLLKCEESKTNIFKRR